jgi:uroporphyrinogen decarboxylase
MADRERRRWQGTDRDIYQDWLDFSGGNKTPRTELGEKKLTGKKGELWQNLERCPSGFRVLRAMMLEREDTSGGEPDRVPVWCMPGTFGAKLVNAGIEEYASNAKLLADAQLALIDKFGVDAVVPFPDMGCIAEAWGTKTKFDAVPSTSKYVVKDSKDWEQLDFIQDIKWPQSGRISQVFDASKALWDKLGFSVPIYGVIPSPLTLACWLGGVERVKQDMKEAPESLHMGMVEIADSMIELVKAYFDASVTVLIMDFQHACGDAFTSEEYVEFGSRYDLKVLERCKTFMAFVGHFAGKEPYLNMAASLYPLILLNWGAAGSNCSLSDAKKAYKTRVAIAGGVSNQTLLSGSAADVDAEAKSAIKVGKQDRSGFILSAGSALSYDMPEENVAAMAEAAKKYGDYPPPKWKTEKWDIRWERNKPGFA